MHACLRIFTMADAGNPTSDPQQAIFIRDILPQCIKDSLKEKQYDMDKVINFQIRAVSRSKNLLGKRRTAFVMGLQEEYTRQNYSTCGPFDVVFLTSCLEEVGRDEREIRRRVLAEQESVEMFKNALETNQVGEEYLTTARVNRDGRTRELQNIVELREILFVAIEILKRIPLAQRNIVPNEKLETLKTAYIEAKSDYLKEQCLLENFTKFKLHPHLDDTLDEETLILIGQKDFVDGDERTLEKVEDDDSKEESESSSNVCKQEPADNFVHFKKTNVDKIDEEFNVMADLASNLLRQEEAIIFTLTKFREKVKSADSEATNISIRPYIILLQSNHPKFKIKLSSKGYNFSLNITKRAKSTMSIPKMIGLLDHGNSIPEELVNAQQQFSLLSAAIKRVCSMHGRCTIALQSLMNKKEELETVTKENPPLSYADSLRVAGHLSRNMKELRRIDKKKDEIKGLANAVLEKVLECIEKSK